MVMVRSKGSEAKGRWEEWPSESAVGVGLIRSDRCSSSAFRPDSIISVHARTVPRDL
jgi:hypothetical protein